MIPRGLIPTDPAGAKQTDRDFRPQAELSRVRQHVFERANNGQCTAAATVHRLGVLDGALSQSQSLNARGLPHRA